MIYICVPTYNEGQTVGVVLWKVRQVMAELARDYQLLVADDGSTDRTPAVLEPYTRVLPLTVLRNAEKRGYSASLEMLLREAARRSEYPRRDVIVVLQADFTEDPEHLATLIRRIESGADIVVSNAGYGEQPPPRAFRWGRALMNRLLRRFPWPEGVRDPLTGLNAYRVVCVKKALDERNGTRLLRFETWAANAELLRETVPHARRIDAVDLTVRRERLQRPERFQFRPVFHEVFAFIRNRPTAVRTADQLAADTIVGGRSQYRTLSAESLRESTAGNGAGGAQRRGRQRQGRDERSSGRTRSGSLRSSEAGSAGGTRKRAASAESQGQRKSRPKRQKPEVAAAADPVAGAREGNGEAVPPKRKRRSRKRSRRTGANGAATAAPGTAPEGTNLSTEENSSGPVMNGGEAPFTGEGQEAAGEAPRPKKRRRGSRGGRRRSRSGGKNAPEANTNETATGPESPPDAAAAG